MNSRRVALDALIVVGLFFAIDALPYFYLAVFGPYQGMSVSKSPAAETISAVILCAGAAACAAGMRFRKRAALTGWEAVVLGSIVLFFVNFFVPPIGYFFSLSGGSQNFAIFILSLLGMIIGSFQFSRTKGDVVSDAGVRAPSPPRHWGVYALVFALAVLAAAGFFIWPVFAFSGVHSCPPQIADLTFQILGSNPITLAVGPGYYHQVVGPPLFSQTQLVLQPSYVAYITYVYNSTDYSGNNLTAWFGNIGSAPYQVSYLTRIDPWTGRFESVSSNYAGINYTFLGIYFQGDTFARLIYRVTVSPSAPPASYALAIPCVSPGLVLTVGSLPYWGPIQWAPPQLMGLLVDLTVALGGAVAVSLALYLYWRKGRPLHPETK